MGRFAEGEPILGRIATTNDGAGDLAVASVVGTWAGEIDLDAGSWVIGDSGDVNAVPGGD